MPAVVVESERLVLRHWSTPDLDDLAAIGTPEVVRMLGGVPWTPDTAKDLIELYRSIQKSLGLTTWAVGPRCSTGWPGSESWTQPRGPHPFVALLVE